MSPILKFFKMQSSFVLSLIFDCYYYRIGSYEFTPSRLLQLLSGSKATILVLATNLKDRKVRSDDKFTKSCGINHLPVRDHRENEAVLFLGLVLIQVLPDVFAIIQALYRLVKVPIKDHSVIIPICVLETCRAAGLALLVFDIFSETDLNRCLFLSCATLFVPYSVKIFQSFWEARNLPNSILRRVGKVMKTIPKAFFTLILFSGTYLWLVQRNDFPNTLTLPAALILYALGNWEAWISTSHAGGRFNKLFQLKYGLKMLSYECRIAMSTSRIIALFAVVGYVLNKRSFVASDVLHSFHFNVLSRESLNVLILAVVIVVVNFYIRCAMRFLAAMKMRLLNFFHPAFFAMPVLSLFILSTCKSTPFCFINRLLKPFGCNWHCIKWPLPVEPFSDYYFTAVWFCLYLFWSYNYVAGKKIKIVNEVIDAMPLVLNGLDVERSIVLFKYEVGKKEPVTEGEDEDAVCTGVLRIINSEIDKTVTLYVCATMWHETKNEMTQMIKSIESNKR